MKNNWRTSDVQELCQSIVRNAMEYNPDAPVREYKVYFSGRVPLKLLAPDSQLILDALRDRLGLTIEQITKAGEVVYKPV